MFSFTEWLNDDGGEPFPVRVDIESDEYGALAEWRVTIELDGVDVDISNRLTDDERTEIDKRAQRELTEYRIERASANWSDPWR